MMRLCYIGIVLCFATGSASEDLPWWKTTTLYQVYPRSFKDSDGNGVGDLKGIIQKAAYFKEIGVDSVWLSPIQTSPMKDMGYDITDFINIDPMFGTMEDFKELVKTLHKLGIKLLLDLVVNHSSDQHPWFQKSLAKEDPYTDFYVWDDGMIDEQTGKRIPKNNWLSEFGGRAWEWYDGRQQFYFHDFAIAQPSLNFRNPVLIEEVENIIKFWLDAGVDGFRMDAAKYLVKPTNLEQDEPPVPGTEGKVWDDLVHIHTQNNPAIFDLLERWANIFYEYSTRPGGTPRALFIEVYNDLDKIPLYYGKDKTSLMQPFNFELLMRGNLALRASDIKKIIDDWMAVLPQGASTIWVIGNHDRIRVADRYGPEMVDAMNLLTGVLPGVRVAYYGEEIGMEDTFIRIDQSIDPRGYPTCRDPERTPMQWDDSVSAGFSTNSKPWLPVNPNYWWLNVAAQRRAKHSHLKVFQALMKARMDPVLQRGDFKLLTPNSDTLLVIRGYKNSYFVLVINMGSEITTYTSLDLFEPIGLDVDLKVTIVSTNYAGYKVGSILRSKSLKLSMRPKSAVLLKSVPKKTSWSWIF